MEFYCRMRPEVVTGARNGASLNFAGHSAAGNLSGTPDPGFGFGGDTVNQVCHREVTTGEKPGEKGLSLPKITDMWSHSLPVDEFEMRSRQ